MQSGNRPTPKVPQHQFDAESAVWAGWTPCDGCLTVRKNSWWPKLPPHFGEFVREEQLMRKRRQVSWEDKGKWEKCVCHL